MRDRLCERNRLKVQPNKQIIVIRWPPLIRPLSDATAAQPQPDPEIEDRKMEAAARKDFMVNLSEFASYDGEERCSWQGREL
ncbi:hypothetical protein [Paracoccus sp. ME4]|uniref:hypothetical protein n=1 Tax=Paracoccus sp. ME4 TaxID=3138066 RepID=UPI00398B18E2